MRRQRSIDFDADLNITFVCNIIIWIMDGHWLTEARRQKGWTQERAAARLGVSQTYLSLLENNRRAVSRRLVRKLQREFEVPATELPVEPQDDTSDAQTVANALGRLGYPGFTHFKRARRVNPAQLLFAALLMRNLEPRLSEALPWIVYRYPDLNWPWLLQRARLHDLQNRLGFVVALARQVAERKEQAATAATLAAVEQQLEPSRLAREDTLCRESMTQAERRWLRKRRPALAQHWNLLTGLVPEHLSYAA
jgi:transcriptional regulator with XRE-family HTH domain